MKLTADKARKVDRTKKTWTERNTARAFETGDETLDQMFDAVLRKLIVLGSIDALVDVDFADDPAAIFFFMDAAAKPDEINKLLQTLQAVYPGTDLAAEPETVLDDGKPSEWWILYVPKEPADPTPLEMVQPEEPTGEKPVLGYTPADAVKDIAQGIDVDKAVDSLLRSESVVEATVTIKVPTPDQDLDTTQLVQRVKSYGGDAQGSYGLFVKARGLKPEVGMKAFREIWDRVGPNSYIDVKTINFAPTHKSKSNPNLTIMVTQRTPDVVKYVLSYGGVGSDPAGLFDQGYAPLAESVAKPISESKFAVGDFLKVTNRYGACAPGHVGQVTKVYTDQYDNEKVDLDFGKNLGGQKLIFKGFPANSGEKSAGPASTQTGPVQEGTMLAEEIKGMFKHDYEAFDEAQRLARQTGRSHYVYLGDNLRFVVTDQSPTDEVVRAAFGPKGEDLFSENTNADYARKKLAELESALDAVYPTNSTDSPALSEDIAPGDSKVFDKNGLWAIQRDATGYYTAIAPSASKNFQTYAAAVAWLKNRNPELVVEGVLREGWNLKAYYDWVKNLKVGDAIEARWMHSYYDFRAKAVITKISGQSLRAKLLEPAGGGDLAWSVGFEVLLPRPAWGNNAEHSPDNGPFPADKPNRFFESNSSREGLSEGVGVSPVPLHALKFLKTADQPGSFHSWASAGGMVQIAVIQSMSGPGWIVSITGGDRVPVKIGAKEFDDEASAVAFAKLGAERPWDVINTASYARMWKAQESVIREAKVEGPWPKSKGHLAFLKGSFGPEPFEYYLDARGDLWRAPVGNVIDVTNGYRIGRWEAPKHLAQQMFDQAVQAFSESVLHEGAYQDFIAAGNDPRGWEDYAAKINKQSREAGFSRIIRQWKTAGVPGTDIANLLRSKGVQIPNEIKRALEDPATTVSATEVVGRGLSRSEAQKIHKWVSSIMSSLHEAAILSEQKELDPIELAVRNFLFANPKPSDKEFHAFADREGIEHDKAEAIAYRLAARLVAFLRGGRSKGERPARLSDEEATAGIEVEAEHADDLEIQRKIGYDHDAEFSNYYLALGDMERHLKQGTWKPVSESSFLPLTDVPPGYVRMMGPGTSWITVKGVPATELKDGMLEKRSDRLTYLVRGVTREGPWVNYYLEKKDGSQEHTSRHYKSDVVAWWPKPGEGPTV